MWDVTLAVQKLSTTLNSQKKSDTLSFSAIKCNSSLYLLPASCKLVLLSGPKLIALILPMLANSRAQLREFSTLLPDSAEHSDNLYEEFWPSEISKKYFFFSVVLTSS
jgi:hypothetical protein